MFQYKSLTDLENVVLICLLKFNLCRSSSKITANPKKVSIKNYRWSIDLGILGQLNAVNLPGDGGGLGSCWALASLSGST